MNYRKSYVCKGCGKHTSTTNSDIFEDKKCQECRGFSGSAIRSSPKKKGFLARLFG
jgi:hypothetical protein